MNIVDELKIALSPKRDKYDWRHTSLEVFKITDGYELKYGAMYEAPELNLKQLKALGDLFGTDYVDVNNYAEGGCDTCDYGSDYGNTIQIREITKNAEELEKLVGKGDVYDE